MLVSGSILSNNLKEANEFVKKFSNTNIDYIHVDVMDGKFVENKTFTIGDIKEFNDLTNKKLDVHLMVNNPVKYVKDLALLNTIYITFHYEAVKDISKLIEEIKNYGIKVGIAINPKTDIDVLKPYINDIDLVLIMSVEPGYSGQSFIESTYDKVSELKKLNGKFDIEVDGGVNNTNASLLKECGANVLVSASFIQNDLNNIDYLKEL